MNVLLTLGLVSVVAAFGGLPVLLLDARSKRLAALRRASIPARKG